MENHEHKEVSWLNNAAIIHNPESIENIMPYSLESLFDLLSHLHTTSRRTKKSFPLPPIDAEHTTPLPSTSSFRILISSFGPNVTKQPSQWSEGASFDLTTSLGLIHLEGMTTGENISLQYYVAHMLGVEGLKELAALLDVYRMFASGRDQTQAIEVSLKQLLQRIGRGNHAEDRDQQVHLLNTILYLSRASIINKEARQTKIAPLLVLENLAIDVRRNVWLSYHLGTETFKAIYGSQQQLFPLPTHCVVSYHSNRACYSLMLTFFLGNLLAQGTHSLFFTTLCMDSGLFTYEQLLPSATNRTRNALRVIAALLQLENEAFIRLDPHDDLDTILAANYCEEAYERRDTCYHPSTLERLEQLIFTLSGESKAELRTQRRKALQKLLNVEASREDRTKEYSGWSKRITIHPGIKLIEMQYNLAVENE